MLHPLAKCYKSFENSNSIFNLSYFWKNDENDAVVDATVKEFPVMITFLTSFT